MPQLKSSDWVGYAMQEILQSESHQKIFNSPELRVKQASKEETPLERAVGILVLASQKMDDLGQNENSLKVLALVEGLLEPHDNK